MHRGSRGRIRCSGRTCGKHKTSAPSEAVDPRTAAPGVLGELTERPWGGPLPD
ncbi:DUF6009 family protein [Streptomyces sp. NPDC085463]|uniref:DUF6009 family protein n=1 Tax=Streptomyces sp. NPDC085463 TaxID=3365724 RepID=UPI0037CFA7F6